MAKFKCECGYIVIESGIVPLIPCPKCKTIPIEYIFLSKKCIKPHEYVYKLNEFNGKVYQLCINCGNKIILDK